MLTDMSTQTSYLTRIRDVKLLPQEKVTHVFSPENGLVEEPWGTGELLVTTSQRVLSFSQDQNGNETFLVPVEDIKGITVKTSGKSSGSMLQAALLFGGAIVVYGVLAYWVVGRWPGPNIPLLNISASSLFILASILVFGWMALKHYFTSGNGSVTFQGSNWSFTFTFSGAKPAEDVYQVVNTTFATRRSSNGYLPPENH